MSKKFLTDCFRHVFGHFLGKFWQILANFSNFWQYWGKIELFFLADRFFLWLLSGKIWRTVKNFHNPPSRMASRLKPSAPTPLGSGKDTIWFLTKSSPVYDINNSLNLWSPVICIPLWFKPTSEIQTILVRLTALKIFLPTKTRINLFYYVLRLMKNDPKRNNIFMFPNLVKNPYSPTAGFQKRTKISLFTGNIFNY